MEELRDRLKMLKQLRWRAALSADGSDGDAATDRLIRLQNAIVAIEAALADGAPVGAATMDLSGYEAAGEQGPLILAESDVVAEPPVAATVTAPARSNGAGFSSGFMRRGALMRYPTGHPWFDAWRRTVERGGYRTRWHPSAR